MVPGVGLEPTHPEGIGGLSPPASTDSATRARRNDSPGNEILTGRKPIGLCLTREPPRISGPEGGGLRASSDLRHFDVSRPRRRRRARVRPNHRPQATTPLGPDRPWPPPAHWLQPHLRSCRRRPPTTGALSAGRQPWAHPRNRSVRCTPSNPGGDRNPGTTRERRRAACPRERAAAANRRLAASTDRHSASGV